MTKQEMKSYEGNSIYALCRRMGGKFRDIDCLTTYIITTNGTFKYTGEKLNCVANNYQIKMMKELTNNNYCIGRPCAERFTKEQIEKLIK